MLNILITTSSFGKESPEVFNSLSALACNPVLNPHERTLKGDELLELLQRHRPVGMLAGTEPITRDIIEESRSYLKVISRVGVGWDNVDRDAAASMGIRVYRTTGVLTQSVAELTVGLILSALRRISCHDRLVREKKWEKHMGALLERKTVGLIGFGEIGQRAGRLLAAFGAEIIFYDPQQEGKIENAKPVSLEELLNQSEIISLHASGSRTILGKEEFKQCRKGVLLVNTARGGLVDEKALEECLSDGQVGFACLDVFDNEPYSGSLIYSDKVLLTPHIGSYAREARIRMEMAAVENLLVGIKELMLI